MQPATEILTFFSRVFTFFYFAFFAVLYVTSKNEKTKPVPDRVTS
jgi:ubiquinol-cytochrome c reductase cytochrome b subunit